MTGDAAQIHELKAGMKVHFIGVGGAGMSAIARVMAGHQLGIKVSGSDIKSSSNTEKLLSEGVEVIIGHNAENVLGCDLVVRSSAISERNPESRAALEAGIVVIDRAEALQLCALEYKTKIFVAGTHGKTTTTSMAAMVLKAAGVKPTFVIGGELNDIGSNAEIGESDIFVAEADESDKSFLHYTPDISIVTNVEGDHFDQYASEAEIDKAFEDFLSRTSPSGKMIICGDNARLLNIAKKVSSHRGTAIMQYGLEPENEFTADDIRLHANGSDFKIVHNKLSVATGSLRIPGIHNVQNALATIALCTCLEIPLSSAVKGLASFGGVKRRFETVAEMNGISVIDDYAHHPTEIAATLDAARTVTSGRIFAVFQPHRFSRTLSLAYDLGGAFSQADSVIITDVYAAGEDPLPGVSGKLIINKMIEHYPSTQAAYLPDMQSVHRYLQGKLHTGDTVLIMGAGDIYSIGPDISAMIGHDQRSKDVHRS